MSTGTLERTSAVLFDLDDTLLVYHTASEEAWDLTCAEFHSETGFDSATGLRAMIDRSRDWFWSDGDRFRKGRMDLKTARRTIVLRALEGRGIGEQISFRIADHYTDLQTELFRLYPDTIQVLTALKSSGHRLGILTNGASDRQNAKIDRFGLRDYFDFCLVEGDLGFGKPDTDAFREALKRFGLPARDAAMIGDNPAMDIAPARAMGFHTVWIRRGEHGLQDGIKPDRTIGTLSELLE
jgi:putative hydrolase of the HAD superfamily